MSDYKMSLGMPDLHWLDTSIDALFDPSSKSIVEEQFPEFYSNMSSAETPAQKAKQKRAETGFMAPRQGVDISKKYVRPVNTAPIAVASIKQATKAQALAFDMSESRYGRQLMEATQRVLRSNNPAILSRTQMLSQRGITINPTVTIAQGTDVPAPTPATPKEVT